MYAPAIEAQLAATECFHCGLPIASAARYVAQVDRVERAMCCPGCCAVAEAIATAGLSDYYRYRTAVAVPQTASASLDKLRLYDLPEVQRTFVRDGEDDTEKEAALLLDGVTCAACVWLIEHRLRQVAGVRAVDINYATRRARVRWEVGATR